MGRQGTSGKSNINDLDFKAFFLYVPCAIGRGGKSSVAHSHTWDEGAIDPVRACGVHKRKACFKAHSCPSSRAAGLHNDFPTPRLMLEDNQLPKSIGASIPALNNRVEMKSHKQERQRAL
jgi:hypothetical protein